MCFPLSGKPIMISTHLMQYDKQELGREAKSLLEMHHCLGAAAYALKAAEQGGINTEQERQWQHQQLPVSIRDLVTSARARRRAYT
jgi:hypothetical protein